MSKIVKLDVPYSSQFLDAQDSFWNIRSCGGACIKMVLDYYASINSDIKSNLSILEIMNTAKETGGYDTENGFIHDWAVKYFKQMGLGSYRQEGLSGFEEIKESLDNNNPVIVSVTKKVLEQNKFHLILIVGYEMETNILNKGGEIVNKVMYHEPESTDVSRGSFRSCDMDTFLAFWRGD